MINPRSIEKFTFYRAEYMINDITGNIVKLSVDYVNGNIETNTKAGKAVPLLIQEVTEIGQDLLKRKRGINFVGHVYKNFNKQ